jgi:hypothetical protein
MSPRSYELIGDDEIELMSHDSLSQTDSSKTPPAPPVPRRKRPSPTQWALALLPLAGHFALSACTVAFMWLYVSGRTFGVSERRASYIESDGSKGMAKHFTILQTDITTTLSIILALTRTCGDVWCGAMCSRAAFILLEKDGMRAGDLTWMLDWGLPASFTPRRVGGHSRIVFITALVLLASLPALFAAPLLTGSITWSPSHTMVLGGVPVSDVPTSADVHDSYSWWWFQFGANRDICRIRAAGSASTAWNTDATSDLGLMKRIVAPAKQLSPNSTMNNITLPYFVMHSLTWLSDISQITQPNLTWAIDPAGGLMNVSSIYNPLEQVTPTLAIIPDEPYHDAIWNQTTQRYMFPEASKVEKKASILALFANRENNGTTCTTRLSDAFGMLPPNVAFLSRSWLELNATAINCYIFANITYSAGAAVCTGCQITSGGIVVSNISALTIQEDAITGVALSMMPEVIMTMAVMNISIPRTYNNIELYTREMLSRSYAASWAVVTDVVGSSFASPWGELPEKTGTLQTAVYIAVPSLVAVVAPWRIAWWYGLQVLLTVSGMVFLGLQMTSSKGLVVEPALEWFLLDTRAVRSRHTDSASVADEKNDVMRLTREDFLVIRYEH